MPGGLTAFLLKAGLSHFGNSLAPLGKLLREIGDLDLEYEWGAIPKPGWWRNGMDFNYVLPRGHWMLMDQALC